MIGTKTLHGISCLLLLVATSCWQGNSFQLLSPCTHRMASLGPRSSTQSTQKLLQPTASRIQQFTLPRVIVSAKSDDDKDEEESSSRAPKVNVDAVVKDAALRLRRLSWASWWAQLILTTISSVTLVFTRNVMQQSSTNVQMSMPNFLLAGTGIVASVVSIFWTWASRRLSRRLLKKETSRIQAANMLRKAINVGVMLNLFGMLTTIIGAEQIVGVLAIKVLTTARSVSLLETSAMLQPLDILVVQANTNTLFSHFCSVVALLYMTRWVAKLDPPSVEKDQRSR